ncbi:chorismate-binding protein, partial [Microbacterium sp.]|uniref:chorismate-binding protein n=1 Tax=Microbacterium sp. TaxID=51671 RepID=UPI003F99C87B
MLPDAPLEARRAPASVDLPDLFRALAASQANLFWLDAGADASEGWSIVGIGEPDAAGPGHVRLDGDAPIADDLPPFLGGWVGWLDYESGARLAGASVAASEDGPAWMRVTAAVALDHATGAVWELGEVALRQAQGPTLSEGTSPRSEGASPRGPFSEGASPRGPLSERSETKRGERAQRVEASPQRAASARHTPDDYAALVERCRDAIRAGDAYQLCLTTRFCVPGAHDAVETYLRLRAATPAHHGGFIRIGERALLSASPEVFLQAEGGRIRTRPIKGTRPRGADPASDAALAAELLASPKERAENVMIVDLMR